MGGCCGKPKDKDVVFDDLGTAGDAGGGTGAGASSGTARGGWSPAPGQPSAQSSIGPSASGALSGGGAGGGEADTSHVASPASMLSSSRVTGRAQELRRQADFFGFPPCTFPRTDKLVRDVKPQPGIEATLAMPRERPALTREQAQARSVVRSRAAAAIATERRVLLTSDADFVVDADTPPIVQLTSRAAFSTRYHAVVTSKSRALGRRAAAVAQAGPEPGPSPSRIASTSSPTPLVPGQSQPGATASTAQAQLHVLTGIEYSNRARNAVRIRRMKIYMRRLAKRKAALTADATRDLYGELGEILRMEAKTVGKLSMLEHAFQARFGVTYKEALDGAYVAEQLVLSPPEERVRKIRADYTSTEDEASES